MTTIREQILDNLTARLEAIRTGGDLGDYTFVTSIKGVHPWRKVELLPADCPAICLYDTEADAVEGYVGEDTYDLKIEIVGLVSNKADMTTIRGLLSDIVAACKADIYCAGLTRELSITKQNLAREVVGDIISAAEVGLSVTYAAPHGRI